ncbi:hypothetical protein CQW23_00185 [Capsicum baccatum]|uniref:NLP1-9 GAF domain-containing protein n=1 Tax=Capsicum baccatum TaxID=33114 RepID=A0A2G2XJZ6_CAPBA|nr:hypothetical protein CQW23_00185 [Capsicum baccatum]
MNADNHVYDDRLCFRDIFKLQPLQKDDQGVVGKAFSFDKLCYCKNITEFCIIEYPLGVNLKCPKIYLNKGRKDISKLQPLQKDDQGVVGKTFSSDNKLCYCKNITEFSIIEYPLVHYARCCGLTTSFAICSKNRDDA